MFLSTDASGKGASLVAAVVQKIMDEEAANKQPPSTPQFKHQQSLTSPKNAKAQH